MPTIYDIISDQMREANQDDIDLLQRGVAAFGAVMVHLRQMQTPFAQCTALIGVRIAQGKMTLAEGARELQQLRSDNPPGGPL